MKADAATCCCAWAGVPSDATNAAHSVGLNGNQEEEMDLLRMRILDESGNTKITPLDWLAQPRMRGAIALVLQKHFVAPSVA